MGVVGVEEYRHVDLIAEAVDYSGVLNAAYAAEIAAGKQAAPIARAA